MSKYHRKWIDGKPYMAPPTGWGGELTDRQLQVLRMAAEGKSYGEIADELLIGYQTVKTHISHILTKMNAKNSVHAVAIAYKTGLIERDASPPG